MKGLRRLRVESTPSPPDRRPFLTLPSSSWAGLLDEIEVAG